MYKSFLKRFFDLSVSSLLVIILSPVFLLIGLLVLFNMGRPVLFIQERPGLQGKIFTIYKFRSMINNNYKKGNPLPDFKKVTKFGNLLRKSSLDELPELFNVITGEMSLVGPRPLLVEYLPLYTDSQARRHEVRPGITGWAQINGRNAIGWEEKFKFDLFYVDHVSFFFDIKIMILTIWKIFKREGINSSSTVTMKKFTGLNT